MFNFLTHAIRSKFDKGLLINFIYIASMCICSMRFTITRHEIEPRALKAPLYMVPV